MATGYLNVASAVTLELDEPANARAVDELSANGVIKSGEDVVAILTASGLKDFGATGIEIPAVPDVVPDMDSVLRALDENYGYHV